MQKKTFDLHRDAAERGVLLVAHRGYDFIQTDWLLACAQFLERTGRRTFRGTPPRQSNRFR